MTVGGHPNLHVAVAIALGRPTSDSDGQLVDELYRRLGRSCSVPSSRRPLEESLALFEPQHSQGVSG